MKKGRIFIGIFILLSLFFVLPKDAFSASLVITTDFPEVSSNSKSSLLVQGKAIPDAGVPVTDFQNVVIIHNVERVMGIKKPPLVPETPIKPGVPSPTQPKTPSLPKSR